MNWIKSLAVREAKKTMEKEYSYLNLTEEQKEKMQDKLTTEYYRMFILIAIVIIILGAFAIIKLSGG